MRFPRIVQILTVQSDHGQTKDELEEAQDNVKEVGFLEAFEAWTFSSAPGCSTPAEHGYRRLEKFSPGEGVASLCTRGVGRVGFKACQSIVLARSRSVRRLVRVVVKESLRTMAQVAGAIRHREIGVRC